MSKIPKKKGPKLDKKTIEIDLDNLPDDSHLVMSADELEKNLDEAGEQLTDLALYGSAPDIADMSWKLYSDYKKGLLPKVFEDDDELMRFYQDRKKETVLKLTTFIQAASTALLDSEKIEVASVRDLTASIGQALKLIQGMVGADNVTQVEHTHDHEVSSNMTERDINERVKIAQDKLNAIDVEVENVETEPIDYKKKPLG
jgi:hypothetical protein